MQGFLLVILVISKEEYNLNTVIILVTKNLT